MPKDYESTVMRMAGSIVSGLMARHEFDNQSPDYLARVSVAMARAIVAEVQRTAAATLEA